MEMNKLIIAVIVSYVYDISMIAYNCSRHGGDDISILPTILFIYGMTGIILMKAKKGYPINFITTTFVLIPCSVYVLIHVLILFYLTLSTSTEAASWILNRIKATVYGSQSFFTERVLFADRIGWANALSINAFWSGLFSVTRHQMATRYMKIYR